eukprot:11197259-Alexandrium_andersonii.AAC.1
MACPLYSGSRVGVGGSEPGQPAIHVPPATARRSERETDCSAQALAGQPVLAAGVEAATGRARVKNKASFDQRVKVTKYSSPREPEV